MQLEVNTYQIVENEDVSSAVSEVKEILKNKINMLSNRNWRARRDAALIIGEFGILALRYLDKLLIATRDENWEVRFASINSLQKIGYEAADLGLDAVVQIGILSNLAQRAVQDSSILIRNKAYEALMVLQNTLQEKTN